MYDFIKYQVVFDNQAKKWVLLKVVYSGVLNTETQELINSVTRVQIIDQYSTYSFACQDMLRYNKAIEDEHK